MATKILFDVTPLSPKEIVGDGTYVYHLYRSLKALGCSMQPIYKSRGAFSKNYIDHHINQSPKNFSSFKSMFASKDAIVHANGGEVLPDGPKLKKILTVYDLSCYKNDLFSAKFCREGQQALTESLFKNPDAVIVPSQAVLGEFLTRFPKFVGKAHVIYHGCDHLLDAASADTTDVDSDPYFLYVGAIEKRKNLIRVVEAFHQLAQVNKDVQLVIAGMDGFNAKVIHEFIDRSPYGERIKRLGYVSNRQLRKLYMGAIALVYPSLYEGFGMPIIEAMKLGTPVITSNLGAMAEIGAEHTHLVTPVDTSAIFGGMERILLDKNYRRSLSDKGIERTSNFTWMACARDTLKLYSSLS